MRCPLISFHEVYLFYLSFLGFFGFPWSVWRIYCIVSTFFKIALEEHGRWSCGNIPNRSV